LQSTPLMNRSETSKDQPGSRSRRSLGSAKCCQTQDSRWPRERLLAAIQQ
jgi:hypothetical protein